MRAGGDGEAAGQQRVVTSAGQVVERSHDVSVDKDLERLNTGGFAPLGSAESDRVRAGSKGHRLADRAAALQKQNLRPLWGTRISGRKCAAVARDAGVSGEIPGGSGRVVRKTALTQRH